LDCSISGIIYSPGFALQIKHRPRQIFLTLLGGFMKSLINALGPLFLVAALLTACGQKEEAAPAEAAPAASAAPEAPAPAAAEPAAEPGGWVPPAEEAK
jgi:predicted small lipoprotein YifL